MSKRGRDAVGVLGLTAFLLLVAQPYTRDHFSELGPVLAILAGGAIIARWIWSRRYQ